MVQKKQEQPSPSQAIWRQINAGTGYPVRNKDGEWHIIVMNKEIPVDRERTMDSWMAVRRRGEVRPRVQLRIVQVDGKHALVNETCWDGYRGRPPLLLAQRWDTWEEAEAVMREVIDIFDQEAEL